jgi:thioredoxin 1
MTEVTDQTFEQEVLKSEVPVLVDFYANWCGPCRAAAPSIEQIAKDFEGKVKVVKNDVDTGSVNAMHYGVRGIPNFSVFYQGTLLKQFTGFNAAVEAELRETLAEILLASAPAASK